MPERRRFSVCSNDIGKRVQGISVCIGFLFAAPNLEPLS